MAHKRLNQRDPKGVFSHWSDPEDVALYKTSEELASFKEYIIGSYSHEFLGYGITTRNELITAFKENFDITTFSKLLKSVETINSLDIPRLLSWVLVGLYERMEFDILREIYDSRCLEFPMSDYLAGNLTHPPCTEVVEKTEDFLKDLYRSSNFFVFAAWSGDKKLYKYLLSKYPTFSDSKYDVVRTHTDLLFSIFSDKQLEASQVNALLSRNPNQRSDVYQQFEMLKNSQFCEVFSSLKSMASEELREDIRSMLLSYPKEHFKGLFYKLLEKRDLDSLKFYLLDLEAPIFGENISDLSISSGSYNGDSDTELDQTEVFALKNASELLVQTVFAGRNIGLSAEKTLSCLQSSTAVCEAIRSGVITSAEDVDQALKLFEEKNQSSKRAFKL